MEFQFNLYEPIQFQLKNIGENLVNSALEDCISTELRNHQKIHSVRKRCKRIRALLRIVRPNLGSRYKSENIFYRDLGRTLSAERDKQVLIESFQAQLNLPQNESIIEELSKIIQYLSNQNNLVDTSPLINDFADGISSGKEKINRWEIHREGFDALSDGIKKTYRRGRVAMRLAQKHPSTENYHEWRKRVKYHYYHLELLIQIWPEIMTPFVDEVHHLSELLGKDHDLCLLREYVIANSELELNVKSKEIFLSTIDSEQIVLREEIKDLGAKVYTERPYQLVKRLEGYWNSN